MLQQQHANPDPPGLSLPSSEKAHFLDNFPTKYYQTNDSNERSSNCDEQDWKVLVAVLHMVHVIGVSASLASRSASKGTYV